MWCSVDYLCIIGWDDRKKSDYVTVPEQSSEDLSPAFVLYLADASFLQHVVTHITEYFKLLETGEFNVFSSLTDNLE